MAVCPTCNHTNPEGATQCEACFTPLPTMTVCPHCASPVQSDATFCGDCGQTIDPSQLKPIAGNETSPGAEAPAVAVAPANNEPIPALPTTPESSSIASLIHVQTQTTLELPKGLTVIHLGKPNDRVPPDVDVSGFAHSDVVSRVHADIRIEGEDYFLEDTGSANGTYVNHTILDPGDRHQLCPGDRVSLGKGDLVTFIFQLG